MALTAHTFLSGSAVFASRRTSDAAIARHTAGLKPGSVMARFAAAVDAGEFSAPSRIAPPAPPAPTEAELAEQALRVAACIAENARHAYVMACSALQLTNRIYTGKSRRFYQAVAFRNINATRAACRAAERAERSALARVELASVAADAAFLLAAD